MENTDKKRFITFLAVAYGVTVVMWVFMFIGLKAEKDLTALVNVQMLYPACGVVLGFLLFGDKEKKLPKAGFIVALITTVIMMVIGVVSVIAQQTWIDSATGKITNWNLYSQYVVMAGSVISYILFWACGKEKRKNAGLSRTNVKLSALLALLFFVLFVARIYVSVFVGQLITNDGTNAIAELNKAFFVPSTVTSVAILLVNFPLSYMVFWGEEYGWRYYLQPILQKKFGLRLGVLILGVVWGAWHLGLDYMFCTTTTGTLYFVSQVITCIALGIFFGYAFMKTQNIWLVSLMHFMNNNFIVLFSGGDVNVMQNNTVTLIQIPIAIISSLVFVVFILAPAYKGKKQEQLEEQNIA